MNVVSSSTVSPSAAMVQSWPHGALQMSNEELPIAKQGFGWMCALHIRGRSPGTHRNVLSAWATIAPPCGESAGKAAFRTISIVSYQHQLRARSCARISLLHLSRLVSTSTLSPNRSQRLIMNECECRRDKRRGMRCITSHNDYLIWGRRWHGWTSGSCWNGRSSQNGCSVSVSAYAEPRNVGIRQPC